MSASHLSGPLTSTNGFVGAVTGAITGAVTGNVTGNLTGNVTGNVTGNITGNVTGNVVSSSVNIGSGGAVTYVKKAAVSVDLASLNAGIMSETSVTLAGALAGDAVIATPPATLDASLEVVGCYVSASDTLKLRVRNNHATDPVDMAAANWVFVLIR